MLVAVGRLPKIWDETYKTFDYVKQPIMQSEIDEWQSKGYYQSSYSGSMYGGKNPMPAWTNELSSILGLTNCGYVFYKMKTLDIMPEHVDHFNTYTQVFNVDRKEVVRALVLLEDWKPGHYLEVQGKAFVNWNAGDYVLWDADVPHAASNIGTEPRYTLQITGVTV